MTPPRRTPPPRALTFIEVVLAAALLAGMAGVITGAVSFMESAAARDRHRLNAMEVGHRIVAQFLDDPRLLPDESLPIQQGESLYRWQLREEVLVKEPETDGGPGKRKGRLREELSAEEQLPEMLNRVTVFVYFDETGAPGAPLAGPPVAELVRIFNPFIGRTEETVLTRIRELVEQAQREQAEKAERERRGKKGPVPAGK